MKRNNNNNNKKQQQQKQRGLNKKVRIKLEAINVFIWEG